MNEPIVAFEGVRYCYGEICALHGATFTIKKRALTALVGPNGGGKSTLIKLLAGLIKPDEGEIWREPGAVIGLVPQLFGFDTSFALTVREFVLMGTLDRQIKPFFRYGDEHRRRAQAAARRAGLEGLEGRAISQLSVGQLKRALIARALASEAELIVLDEPDAGLDVDAARELYAMLASIKADRTVVVASHSVGDVLDIADAAVYVGGYVEPYDDPARLNEKLNGGVVL